MSSEPYRILGLEADVDARLADLYALIWSGGLQVNETVASCIRTAYVTGYHDALTEVSEGRPGTLHRAHGYAHP